jgi:hypothetical protein
MVWNEEEFDAALREADAMLDNPPVEGSPAYERLITLLADIASYRPNIFKPAEPPLSEERARLAKHLESFEARVKPHYGPHWSSLVGGDFRFS